MHKETRGMVVKYLLTAFKSWNITHHAGSVPQASFFSLRSIETNPPISNDLLGCCLFINVRTSFYIGCLSRTGKGQLRAFQMKL